MEAVITSPVEEHGCGYPDAPCRSCEAAYTPPCCHTPNLCGGPHPDCYEALRAEAVDPTAVPNDAIVKPLYSGPHGDYTLHAVGDCDDCDKPLTYGDERDRGSSDNRAGTGDIVVHIDQRRRCCAKDGCRPDCR
jgi:hypothetical protein